MTGALRKLAPRGSVRDNELTNAVQLLTDGVSRLGEGVDEIRKSVDEIKSDVTVIKARDFDGQLKKLENDTDKAIQILHDSNKVRDARLLDAEKLLAKFGAFLAVAGAIGGALLGVIGTKVFGG